MEAVSSLSIIWNSLTFLINFNQWKAAKEELNENDEDEPENAYEILEKKRQREIEVCKWISLFINCIFNWWELFPYILCLQEWHAQQIASGEAKDNANFQPLGGDWYEIL